MDPLRIKARSSGYGTLSVAWKEGGYFNIVLYMRNASRNILGSHQWWVLGGPEWETWSSETRWEGGFSLLHILLSFHFSTI